MTTEIVEVCTAVVLQQINGQTGYRFLVTDMGGWQGTQTIYFGGNVEEAVAHFQERQEIYKPEYQHYVKFFVCKELK